MHITTLKVAIATGAATLACAGTGVAVAATTSLTPDHAHRSARSSKPVTPATHASARRRDQPSDGRPRATLFMTEGQTEALYRPYDSCLAEHTTTSEPGIEKWKLAGPAALSACRSKDPLPPWQFDTTNPQSLPFVNAVITCLRSEGVTQAAVQPSAGMNTIALGGPDNDQSSITIGLDDMTHCEHVALGQ